MWFSHPYFILCRTKTNTSHIYCHYSTATVNTGNGPFLIIQWMELLCDSPYELGSRLLMFKTCCNRKIKRYMCITACFWVRVLVDGVMTSCALLHERTANIKEERVEWHLTWNRHSKCAIVIVLNILWYYYYNFGFRSF